MAPVVSWQDLRAAGIVARWQSQDATLGGVIQAKTGLRLTPHYGAGKMRWWLEHHPPVALAARKGVLRWGPMAAWLVHTLLAEHPWVVDPQNGSRTLLWNLSSGDWDKELPVRLGLPPGEGFLPRLVPTRHPYGMLHAVGRPIPFLVLNGDQSAALFGFGPPREDWAYVNIGTGAFVQRVSSRLPERPPGLLAGVVYTEDPPSTVSRSPAPLSRLPPILYSLEGTVNGAASALDWLAETQGVPAEELLKRLPGWLAPGGLRDGGLKEGGEGEPPLFLNGVSGLGSPYWRADFPSRFVGLDGRSIPHLPTSHLPVPGLAALAAAVVESILFLIQVNLERMDQVLPSPQKIMVSGGLSRMDGLCQSLADLTRKPVSRRDEPEATARGVAFLTAGGPPGWEPAVDAAFLPRNNPGLTDRFIRWQPLMEKD
ncbi:MAG: FGGY-family carbohydrate kinase [Deltaproteobacteria bacterium]|nr:FGGY-family carbohydrate kinase [Deltaproteobacteria bacterium]